MFIRSQWPLMVALTGGAALGVAHCGGTTTGGATDASVDQSNEDVGSSSGASSSGGGTSGSSSGASGGSASGGNSSGGGTTEAGAVACPVDAGVCAAGEVCLDNVFINGLPRPPDSGPPPPPSNTYSCKADPCGGVPDTGCYCTLCFGGMCQTSPAKVTCTQEAVCASAGTPIATADGERPIASVHVGDLVYSADHGALRLVPVVRVGRVAVYHHHVVELSLSNGSVLRLSAGHPMVDGRLVGALQTGDRLEGASVVGRRDVAYAEPYTYDILPASETHSYVAAGVLVGSTLSP
jgi:hypothetical protein